MIQITHKSNSLRKAVAQAVVIVSKESTMDAVIHRTVPKGDVLEFARVAGLFAVKKTSDVIPDCHPLPVEFTQVSYELAGLEIRISVEVHTVYKTGVEVEAMHGASVVALTLYDMLKPIDKGIEISNIRLISKTGGKSDAMKLSLQKIIAERKAMVLVCSDSISQGKAEDQAGAQVSARLVSMGLQVMPVVVLPDQMESIQQAVHDYGSQVDLMLFLVAMIIKPLKNGFPKLADVKY
jgi:cyclic pyranopterin phosphate synthase